ncbi:MAG: hypothetical protein KJ601_03235 [Nanoarchaeota archaeon]|nr:hypothetical protein [Nanoarchaeota archaeon]
MPIHYEPGAKSEAAVVFSCPGRYEEMERRPLAATTGKNFDTLCSLMNDYGFPVHMSRRDVTITNSWSRVEYDEKTGRSEATLAEILGKWNSARLAKELKEITDYIICFGDTARFALDPLIEEGYLTEGCTILYTGHLSLRALNAIKIDADGDEILSAKAAKANGDARSLKKIGKDNTLRRLEVIAQGLVSALDE